MIFVQKEQMKIYKTNFLDFLLLYVIAAPAAMFGHQLQFNS